MAGKESMAGSFGKFQLSLFYAILAEIDQYWSHFVGSIFKFQSMRFHCICQVFIFFTLTMHLDQRQSVACWGRLEVGDLSYCYSTKKLLSKLQSYFIVPSD